MKLTDTIERANYLTVLAAEREQKVWWRAAAFVLLVTQVAAIAGGLFTFTLINRPWFVHAGPGLVSDEPTQEERIYVAWEAARGLLSVTSSTVTADLETTRSWMTTRGVEELDRALAEFERTQGVSYEQSIASRGTATDFDSFETRVEEPTTGALPKSYPVVISGTRTTLTGRSAPSEGEPFTVRVWLVRVTESPTNPIGLLADRFERLDGSAFSDTRLGPIKREQPAEPTEPDFGAAARKVAP